MRPASVKSETAHGVKTMAALSSVAASAALTLVKLLAGLLSGSLALLSEAAHGAVDTGATFVTWLAVRESGKPADDDHHFGHEKFEALAALFQVFLLFDVALVVVVEAVRRLRSGQDAVEITPWVFAVLALSVIVDLVRWRSLARIARATGSDALAADAVHFSSDLVSSLIVAAGLIAYAFGWHEADAFASFGVACVIMLAAARLARKTLDTLLDKAPDGLAPQLRELAQAVPGVTDVGDIRLRRLGGRTVGDMTVGVARTLPLDRIGIIRQAVIDSQRRYDPDLDVAITTAPRTLDDESMLERVLLVAARRRLAVHHVTVQRVGARTSISFDLEVDGAMAHGRAHEIATALEAAISAEVGPGVEVESHIEPLTLRELEGADVDDAMLDKIRLALIDAAAEAHAVHDVHQVRARHTADGLVVNYHCRVDPNLRVAAVHDCVDAVDHAVRVRHPEIVRLVGHAEPFRTA